MQDEGNIKCWSTTKLSETFLIFFDAYALVICKHFPPAPRNKGDFDFCPADLRCEDIQLVKSRPFSPRSLLCFHYTVMFADIRKIPVISSALRVQWKSKNTALFPATSGAGGRGYK